MVRIGRYEVLEEIGRGAMGVVYLAHDPRMRRPLAVKTCQLPRGLDAGKAQECRARFVREAQSAGALSHPAIVTIYDVDEDASQGSTYIAMEYVPGKSLRDELRLSGRLQAERAVHLGITLAAALQVAHAAGIVHRDIKPGNILVRDPDGAFKIADFGIARFTDSDLTQDGSTLGSPAYMSPEQLRSLDIDGRSDLFSLASVLFETLTGVRPFKGKDLPALSYAVVHENPPLLRSLARDLPASLDSFFAKALAKDADKRYQDGRSFATALELAWQRRTQPATISDRNDGVESSARADGEEAGAPRPRAQETEKGAALGESTSGSYKPRAPMQVLQRVRAEQRLTDLDVIPIKRSMDEPYSGTSELSVPERHQRRWSGRRAWVYLLLLAATLAGFLAANNYWRGLQVPLTGELVMEVESQLQGGTLRVISDGKMVFVAGLQGDTGTPLNSSRQRGTSLNSDSRPTLRLSEGDHLLTVQVNPRGETRSYQQQLNVHVEAGGSHRLRIVTGLGGDPIPTLAFD